MYIFPNLPDDSEAVFVFVPSSTKINIASNCEYEVWNNNEFIGMGGRRCHNLEAYLNTWSGESLRIRLHWINPKLTSVWYRCLFNTPFLYYKNANDDEDIKWKCYQETSIKFAAQACNQLARQNIIYEYDAKRISINRLDISWDIVDDPVSLMDHILTDPQYVTSGKVNGKSKSVTLKHDDVIHDVVKYIQSTSLKYDTYDLGIIALHKFILPPGLYCYTQTASIKDEWINSNQKKVRLADSVIGSIGSPIGYRGCRYLHIFYSGNKPIFNGKIWRAQYPFRFKEIPDMSEMSEEYQLILKACQNTMIACVDGGFVDTCWRERAQWTGDSRMMAKAVKALTYNKELVPFVFQQISKSYDKNTGMVNEAWPVLYPDAKIIIPGFHLAFCLAVYENNLDDLKPIVLDSIDIWKKKYSRNGLISHLPGWLFTDWDFSNKSIIGKDNNALPNCIINTWFRELCSLADVDSDISEHIFMNSFYSAGGYSLYPHGEINFHATAAVISSGLDIHNTNLSLKNIKWRNRVTPYFGYFVAKSLKGSQKEYFINNCYFPSAKKYGTIWEKHDDTASIAHGWSVAISELLLENLSLH